MPTNRKRSPQLTWEEPPARSQVSTSAHKEKAAALMAAPGRWAIVATYTKAATAASVASGVRKGLWGAWRPAGAFEAKSRFAVIGKNRDGSPIKEYRVYARYVGDEPTKE